MAFFKEKTTFRKYWKYLEDPVLSRMNLVLGSLLLRFLLLALLLFCGGATYCGGVG
jgi:hypothetical protein